MNSILVSVRKWLVLIPAVLLFLVAKSQLVSGPMLGYVEHTEAAVWLEVKSEVAKVEIRYFEGGNPNSYLTAAFTGELGKSYNPVSMVIRDLKIGQSYGYEIWLDGKKVGSESYKFSTRHLWQWREPAPDFSFLFGSCLYVNDSIHDRPGKPYGRSLKILKTMGNTTSDFMLWGGDNLYLRESDWSSKSGIDYRYSYNRRTSEMRKLLSSRPQYAIWDDHDYGPNDGNRSYPLKQYVLETFQNYWPQKAYGNDVVKGNFSKFEWSDCEFFLLDNRTFRETDEVQSKSKPYLGKDQLDWLKSSLIASQASFKFIVGGSQFFNQNNKWEGYHFFPEERKELVDYITKNKITGVVFLSGDIHHSEVRKKQIKGSYPFYEITCSPISSGTYKSAGEKIKNTGILVEGSYLVDNNFSKISVNGQKGERKLTLEWYDKSGSVIWTWSLNMKELVF